ncbi:MAG: single-stranded-DNA-specific exonuclease RecJ [Cyanobacteria bacterium J06614_10]
MAAVNWPEADWQVTPVPEMAAGWVETVEGITGLPEPVWGAQLLWLRGIRSAEALKGFWRAADYVPSSPFEFGEEMAWAVSRLMVAYERRERVAIWGDFDADGVTSTAVLWDGLRQFFSGEGQLSYFIPNRLKASHGLAMAGLTRLAEQGVQLVVTCDTGSTNPREIEYAQSLGMDVIVTDHHTLPAERPAVVAIVNPRALLAAHPMAHLSGVAVAYKLVEALYEKLPAVPTRSLNELVDLVAIGLIADLVELRGDCRYLAQIGIEQLQTHLKAEKPLRPGVAQLLKLCRRAGDRPTDISFGLGPRINAVSRIYGDARFCVELLTSNDPIRCQQLAEKAELANARRKALQRDVLQQVTRQLETRDLSTTGVIVLCDPQWPVGVLGLVAGQIAQQYGKPTILLTEDAPGGDEGDGEGIGSVAVSAQASARRLARGSARSVNGIDLYDLVRSQAHLLTGFGGHPFAAGLSLPVEDLALFRAAINQQYRQKLGSAPSQPTVQADITVQVADLGQALFQELKLLEPCGMGNPVPKLLIKNAWFEDAWHQKLKDRTGGKVGYIKASFKLCDESGGKFPGLWWGHYKEDLPPGRWDVVAELDFNSHPKYRRYEVRLIAIRPAAQSAGKETVATGKGGWLLDRRPGREEISARDTLALDLYPNADDKGHAADPLVLNQCPTAWKELRLWQHQSNQVAKPLALAYASPETVDPVAVWTTLMGLAKHLSRTGMAVTREQLGERVGVCDRTLNLGLAALSKAGFTVQDSAIDLRFQYAADGLQPVNDELREATLSRFLAAVQEEAFRRRYFYQADVDTLELAVTSEA